MKPILPLDKQETCEGKCRFFNKYGQIPYWCGDIEPKDCPFFIKEEEEKWKK